METVRLKNGNDMPAIGFGTWELTGKACTDAVEEALRAGYRHIDTEKYYRNEREVADTFLAMPFSPSRANTVNLPHKS